MKTMKTTAVTGFMTSKNYKVDAPQTLAEIMEFVKRKAGSLSANVQSLSREKSAREGPNIVRKAAVAAASVS